MKTEKRKIYAIYEQKTCATGVVRYEKLVFITGIEEEVYYEFQQLHQENRDYPYTRYETKVHEISLPIN